MPVVADSSTLISLASIGRLSLLREFHGKILIPPAVWREVVLEGRGRPGASEVRQAQQAGWVEVAEPSDRSFVVMLRRELDDGEAEAIALAREKKAEVVLLDETDARRIAEVLGIPRAGVVGVLLRARLEGRIPSLQAELDRLRRERGFRLADTIYRAVLERAGEVPEAEER
ncbi:MAG: DUF3368 domain-containing protein [Moorellales bacterium]